MTDIREKSDQLAVYEEMVRGMSEAVVLVGLRRGLPIVYVNPSATRLLGETESELVHRTGTGLLAAHLNMPGRFHLTREIFVTVRRGGEWSGEISLRRRNSRFVPVLLRARLIRSERYGNVVLLMAADITNEKAARRELEEERDRANAATEAKSRFLAYISHEIRNPLNALLGYAQILQSMSVEMSSHAMKMIDSMIPAGRNLLRIVNDVLDLEKIESGKMTLNLGLVAVDELLQDLQATLDYRTMVEGTRFETKMLPGTPNIVRADRVKFYQILLNLTANAANYSPKGSKVLVMVKHSGGFLYCDVVDEGPGVPPAFENLLFKPFERDASTKERGTGLGLFIASEHARMMGGRLEYQRLSSGSLFRFVLPLTEFPRTEGLAKDVHQLPAQTRFPGLRVLVVDDDAVNRMMIQSALEMAGCVVFAEEDAEKGHAAAVRLSPHIVFTDFQMPGMNGLDLIREVRRSLGSDSTRTVLVTGDIFASDITGIETAEVDHVLAKPFLLSDVYGILTKFFGEKNDEAGR